MRTSPRNIVFSLLLASALALLGATGATAGPISGLPANGTVTEYDAGSGQTSFDWDADSVYDIVDTEVTVLTSDIAVGGDDDNGNDARTVGTLFEFVIPNFFDPLPEKTIKVTMRGQNSGARGLDLPSVLDIIGSDSPFDVPGPSTPVFGEFVDGTFNPTEVVESWALFPNPDFEIVKIFAPTGFELSSIRIETQSIPEPATIGFLGMGLLGLAVAGRRRR